jgi:hypothetical protein
VEVNDTTAAERHPVQNLLDQAAEFAEYLGLSEEALCHIQDFIRSAYATGIVKGGSE